MNPLILLACILVLYLIGMAMLVFAATRDPSTWRED